MRLLACMLALAIAGCSPGVAPSSTEAGQSRAGGDPAIEGNGMLKGGARMRVKSRAGTFKPIDTGHPVEVNIPAGQTGSLVRVVGELSLVRWDAQEWQELGETGPGPMVQLKSFE